MAETSSLYIPPFGTVLEASMFWQIQKPLATCDQTHLRTIVVDNILESFIFNWIGLKQISPGCFRQFS